MQFGASRHSGGGGVEEIQVGSRSASRRDDSIPRAATTTAADGVEVRLLRAEVAAQNRLVTTLKGELQRSDEEAATWRARAEDLDEQVAALKSEVAAMARRRGSERSSSATSISMSAAAAAASGCGGALDTSTLSADEEAVRALADAAAALRDKDAAIRRLERLVAQRDAELKELTGDIAALEREVATIRNQQQQQNHQQHDWSQSAATPLRNSATSSTAVLATLYQLTSPDRRVDEELAMLAEQLRLKQRQAADLEDQLAECARQKGHAQGELHALQRTIGDLQTQLRAAQTTEVELRAHAALQAEALAERAGVVELLKREFVALNDVVASRVAEVRALQRENEELKRGLDDAATLRHELERERRMCRAARDVLRLREQEIATLTESLGSLRARSLSASPPRIASTPAAAAGPAGDGGASERSQAFLSASWGGYFGDAGVSALSSSDATARELLMPPSAPPSVARQPQHDPLVSAVGAAARQTELVREENAKLRAELASFQAARRIFARDATPR